MTTLSKREQQVCGYICRGFSNKEVAAALGISHRTAEDHRWNILQKYQVRNVVELVRAVYCLDGEMAE